MSGYVYGATSVGNNQDVAKCREELMRVRALWRAAVRKNEKLVGHLEKQDTEITKLRERLEQARWEAAEAKQAPAQPAETVAYEGYLNPGDLDTIKTLCERNAE